MICPSQDQREVVLKLIILEKWVTKTDFICDFSTFCTEIFPITVFFLLRGI